MKDNYSWLDTLLWELAHEYDRYYGGSEVEDSKQTIISQIEIEKLRANIELLEKLKARELPRLTLKDYTEMGGNPEQDGQADLAENIIDCIDEEIAQLQEKLKETEVKDEN